MVKCFYHNCYECFHDGKQSIVIPYGPTLAWIFVPSTSFSRLFTAFHLARHGLIESQKLERDGHLLPDYALAWIGTSQWSHRDGGISSEYWTRKVWSVHIGFLPCRRHSRYCKNGPLYSYDVDLTIKLSWHCNWRPNLYECLKRKRVCATRRLLLVQMYKESRLQISNQWLYWDDQWGEERRGTRGRRTIVSIVDCFIEDSFLIIYTLITNMVRT